MSEWINNKTKCIKAAKRYTNVNFSPISMALCKLSLLLISGWLLNKPITEDALRCVCLSVWRPKAVCPAAWMDCSALTYPMLTAALAGISMLSAAPDAIFSLMTAL